MSGTWSFSTGCKSNVASTYGDSIAIYYAGDYDNSYLWIYYLQPAQTGLTTGTFTSTNWAYADGPWTIPATGGNFQVRYFRATSVTAYITLGTGTFSVV